ncbi:hypothetical protein NRIC_09750 [Enterococcus florum]|uniref:Uncharacterized protein n=1 Tax=Enterococcus florum TaxID=2480627 RepID=A0A4P5P9T0_9ENTE|nr:hypothetical protein [Enterococcus florum]GCF93084.1 hypothetical protein NRIC_09750 [Enterococcus florum]
MNKQEIIDGIKRMQTNAIKRSSVISNHLYAEGLADGCSDCIKFVELLDEPQKVKVPAIIYMWLDYCKWNNYPLRAAMDEGNMRSYQRATDREGLPKWFESKENQDLFSQA